ncbi:MAG TPA: ATP-binding protein [Candidatus Cloacimonadota bacterium]|nr:ATP-binding protein [Candidatus Cloacimonadota bacterium]HPM02106.1 ATP-binding protein [Candidatus Cloacimonadota bacterium]
MTRLKTLKTSKLTRMYYTIALFCIVLNLAIIYQTFLYNKQVKEKAVENLKSRNTSMARIYEEYSKRTLNSINQILYDIKLLYEKDPSIINLEDYYNTHFLGYEDIVNLLSISDEYGNVSMFNIKNAKAVNVSDRPYFAYHRTNPGRRMYVGHPSLGRATGKWFIPMTMRINKKDGSFGGVVIASINPYYFINFFKQVIQGRIFMLNEDGIIISCWTDNNFNELGKDYSSSPVFSMTKYADQGIDDSKSIFDQVKRIRAFRVIRDYNVILIVSNSIDNAYHEIEPYLIAYNNYSAILIICISIFSFWMFIGIRNQHSITRSLIESETKANSILNTMTEGVAVLSNNRIVFYNPRTLKILKADHHYIKAHEFFEFFKIEDRLQILDNSKKLLAGEKIEKRFEYQIKCMDGQLIWIHVDSSTISWQGNPALLLCFNDITAQKEWTEREHQQMMRIESINYRLENEIHERKMLENERITMINELNQKNEELERFVYTVSHDLRSPLISLKGFTNFLKQDIMSEHSEKALNDIQRIEFSADKMASLIEDLLEVSRAGRIMRAFTSVNLEHTVQDVLSIIQIFIQTKKAQIIIDTPLPDITGDKQKIRQLYQNLIENAIKYTPPERTPQVHLGFNQGLNAFYVSDNGIGISEEYKDTIYDVFKKLSGDSTGSGIGLSIVKRIIESHHGKIWYESQLDEGTCFYFTLDLNHPEQIDQ